MIYMYFWIDHALLLFSAACYCTAVTVGHTAVIAVPTVSMAARSALGLLCYRTNLESRWTSTSPRLCELWESAAGYVEDTSALKSVLVSTFL